MRAVLIVTAFLFCSFKNSITYPKSTVLYGVIVSAETGLPVNNVYVYVVSGEEEALTNKKGEFKFTSWQPLPISLKIKHPEFEETKLLITDASKTIQVKLKKK